MASLTGQLVAETYKALLKTIDNDILTASEKQITDGFGGGSNVFIDSQGFLRANKYKVTNGLATQFLKADGSLDSNTYLTGITSSQIISALGYTPVTNARTLTINGTTYDLSDNRSWTIDGTSAVWGNISGTLSNQTDLQNALNAKYNNPTGTISQYIRGDGSLATFPTLPGGLPTGGTAGQILAKIDATDYNTHWIDNYATQTKNEVKLGATLSKGTPVYVSSANGTNMIVSAASNTTEATSSKTFGLLETGGVTNDLVKCVTFGLLAGLDTSAATAGDPVWLGPNGTLLFGVANKPVAPAHMVYIGVVTRVQQNNGEIFVNVQNGFEIEELHDVLIQSKVNNQGLFYESSTGLWKNKSIATVLGYTPQAQLNGTGFVKASGTTISYDNSTYLTTTDAASTYQPLDADLTAIAALSGTSGFLKKTAADTWALDTNSYLTTSVAASTYQRLDKMVSNLLASDTEYPNSNAVLAKLALKADAANPVFTGNMTISGIAPKLYFTDTDNNPDYTIFTDSGYFYIYDQTAGATKFQITPSGNAINTGTLTSASFIKSGGTSSQFLMADGSVSTGVANQVTGTGTTNYLPKFTGASTIGNSIVQDDGTTLTYGSGSGLKQIYINGGGYDLVLGASGGGMFGFTSTNASLVFSTTAKPLGIGTGAAQPLVFGTNQLERARIDASSGNLLIGTTTDAGYKLDVNGTGRFSGALSGTSASFSGLTVENNQNGSTWVISKNTNSGAGAAAGFLMTNNTGDLAAISLLSSGNSPANGLFIRTLSTNSLILGTNSTATLTLNANNTATFSSSVDMGLNKFFTGGGYKMHYRNSATNITFSGTSNWQINNDADNVALMTVLNGGNVGIGTTSPLTNLQVTNSSGEIFRLTNTTGAERLHFYTRNATSFTRIGSQNSALQLFTEDVGFDLMLGTSNQERMRITSGGNVLIGTTTDAGYKLDVNGTGRFSSNFYVSGGTNVNTGNGIHMYYESSYSQIQLNSATGSLIDFSTSGTDYLARIIYTNATNLLEFKNNAGTTNFSLANSGAATFSSSVTAGAGLASGNALVLSNGTNARQFQLGYSIGAGYNYFQVYDGASFNPLSINGAMYFNSSGNVGIGTTAPETITNHTSLTINGTSVSRMDYKVSGTKMGLVAATTSQFLVYSQGEFPLLLGSSDTERMRITSGGNVLIGTTTDAGYKLDVNGTGRFQGTLTIATSSSPGLNISKDASTDNRYLRLTNTQASSKNWDLINQTNANSNKFVIYNATDNLVAFEITPGGAATLPNGSITATSFFESSDKTIKTLLVDNYEAKGIESITAKLYIKDGKQELGYFAQDVQGILPSAVSVGDKGLLSLSYREVHTAKIARLEKEVAELKAKLNAA